MAHHLISEVEANHIINPAVCLADPNCAGDPEDAVILPTQNGFDNNLNPTGQPSNFPYGAFNANIGVPLVASYGQQSSFGNSNYNAFQATINKSLSHGLTFLLAYTYSHSLDNGSSFENSGFGGVAGPGLNPFNFHDNYGDSAFDARHRMVLSYTYNIPSLQHIAHWIPSRVADGWRFGGITTFQGGFPIYAVEGDGQVGDLQRATGSSISARIDRTKLHRSSWSILVRTLLRQVSTRFGTQARSPLKRSDSSAMCTAERSMRSA